MLPGGVGVIFFLLALIPGWLYLRLRERLEPPSKPTALKELLEVTAVGLATTGFTAITFTLIPHRWLPFLLDVDAWGTGGNHYLRLHIQPALLMVGIVLVAAALIAYIAHLIERTVVGSRAEFRAGEVWAHALGARPAGRTLWVGLQLKNGMLVEGLLHSFSVGEAPGVERDLALRRPIMVTELEGPRVSMDLDRVLIREGQLSYITVHHAPESEPRQVKSAGQPSNPARSAGLDRSAARAGQSSSLGAPTAGGDERTP